eukprot:1144813-Pelagomonas_calceolata.AAC.2
MNQGSLGLFRSFSSKRSKAQAALVHVGSAGQGKQQCREQQSLQKACQPFAHQVPSQPRLPWFMVAQQDNASNSVESNKPPCKAHQPFAHQAQLTSTHELLILRGSWKQMCMLATAYPS